MEESRTLSKQAYCSWTSTDMFSELHDVNEVVKEPPVKPNDCLFSLLENIDGECDGDTSSSMIGRSSCDLQSCLVSAVNELQLEEPAVAEEDVEQQQPPQPQPDDETIASVQMELDKRLCPVGELMVVNTVTDLTQNEINDILSSLVGGHKTDETTDGQTTLSLGNGSGIVFNEFSTSNDELLEYLKVAMPSVLQSNDGETIKSDIDMANVKMQCNFCTHIFTVEAFEEHVCEYDENHNYIKDENDDTDGEETAELQRLENTTEDNSLVLDMPCSNQEFVEHPVWKLLEANNATIHKWLKNDYKLDLSEKGLPAGAKKHEGPHHCTMCERKFVHASGLSRHMEKHDQDQSAGSAWSEAMNLDPGSKAWLEMAVKCIRCLRIFKRIDDAEEHVQSAHERMVTGEGAHNAFGELNMELSDDERETTTSKELHPDGGRSDIWDEAADGCNEEPLSIVFLSAILQCEFCEMNFSGVAPLLQHSASHDPMNGYECTNCNIQVNTVKEIMAHWHNECPFERFDASRKCAVQRYFVCNVCEHKFTTAAQFYEHRRESLHFFPRKSARNGNKLRLGCEECGHQSDSATAAIVHHAEHTAKTRSTAKRGMGGNAESAGGGIKGSKIAMGAGNNDAMSEQFGGSGLSKYRQYLCDVCGKSYTQSSHLWQHLRFHKGVKPFACKEPNCTRRFTIRPDLNDHIRKCHTGERPYHCQICGKRFLTGSVFYQHRLIHRGERRYGCDNCGKRFYRADALKNHQRIHTGEKPYACDQCQKTFRQRGDRDKHVRARHSGLLAAKERAAASSIAGAAGHMVAPMMGRGRIRCKKDLLMQRPPMPRFALPFGGPSTGAGAPNGVGDVLFVGNMAFPSSIFHHPVVHDIDEQHSQQY